MCLSLRCMTARHHSADEVYDDTAVDESNATVDSGLYEIEDDEPKPQPTPTKTDAAAISKKTKESSKKSKKAKTKKTAASDDDSLSSAGSAKDAAHPGTHAR